MEDCARRAGCSVGSVAKVMKNVRDFGTVSNPLSKHTGRPRVVNDGDDLYIREIIKTHPTIYLNELQIKLETIRDVFLSIATISHTLRRLGLSNKRVQRATSERDEELRAIWEGILGQPEYQDPDLFKVRSKSREHPCLIEEAAGTFIALAIGSATSCTRLTCHVGRKSVKERDKKCREKNGRNLFNPGDTSEFISYVIDSSQVRNIVHHHNEECLKVSR